MDKNEIIRFFRLHREDSASICIEIGILSDKIFDLENRLKTIDEEDPDFFICRLEIIQKARSRRKLLELLKKTNMGLHEKVMTKVNRWYTPAPSLSALRQKNIASK